MSTHQSSRRGTRRAAAVDKPAGAIRSDRRRISEVVACVALAVVTLAGCQSARPPMTVAPPATGMIGQPAPYGVSPQPMGAAYPATTVPTMPGPATQWQASAPAAPAMPAAQPPSTWSWTQPQPAAPTYQAPPQIAAPSSQSLTNQAQQFANQMQAQPQQFANQMQNSANQQWQQLNNQAQQQANQYMNQAQQQANQYMNQAGQQAQQYMNGAQQQVTAQMPAYQPQPTSTSWNPFATSPQALPPARATPVTTVPRY